MFLQHSFQCTGRQRYFRLSSKLSPAGKIFRPRGILNRNTSTFLYSLGSPVEISRVNTERNEEGLPRSDVNNSGPVPEGAWPGQEATLESRAGKRRSKATRGEASLRWIAGGSRLLLVPEDRQRHQRYRDDPENDVLAATFFLFIGHKRNTAYPKPGFKCRPDFLAELRSYGLDAALAAPARLYPVNFTISRT